MSAQPLPALLPAAMLASAYTPPVRLSPCMPSVSSRYHRNDQCSMEIPFASEGSHQAAANVEETRWLADDPNLSEFLSFNHYLMNSRKRSRASAVTSSAGPQGGIDNKQKAARLTYTESGQSMSSVDNSMSAEEAKAS